MRPGGGDLVPTDLSIPLLYRLLERLGTLRDSSPSQVSTLNFEDLVDPGLKFTDDVNRRLYIHRHFEFLRDCGYIQSYTQRTGAVASGLELTANGQMFVQPNLAEFGQPLLPQIVTYVEQKIEMTVAPSAEKEALRYKLRDAVVSQSVDAFMKLIFETLKKYGGI